MIAKGPNILNLNAYTQGQEENEQSDYPDNQERLYMQNNSKSIENQFDNFIKELHKYDQILNNVAQDLDDIAMNQPQFLNDFYPSFIVETTYEDDQQKKVILSSDPQMVRILINLQKTNKNLKQQMKGWSMQFSKKAQLSQTLISQNQILREAVCRKNEQLLKLIQIISTTQSEQITEMKQNLQILKQQNGLLLDHLMRMKQQLKQKRQDQQRFSQAYEDKRVQLIEVQKENRQIEDQQEHLSKSVALLDDGLEEMLRRKNKLEKEKARLLSVKQDYTKDQSSIENKYKQSEQDKRTIQYDLKIKFEQNTTQKHRLLQEIQEQSYLIQKIKLQARNLQNQIQRKQNRLQQFNKLNKDLQAKCEQNGQILEKLKKQTTKSIQEEGLLQADVYVLENDIDSLKEDIRESDRLQKQLQESHKQALKATVDAQSRVLAEQKNRQAKQNKELVKKIFEENLQLSLKQKQMRDWELKIQLKKQEMNELKAQMKQTKSNQMKLSQLKTKLSSRQFVQ